MTRFGFTNEANHGKTKTTERNTATATTHTSTENSEPTQNEAGATPTKDCSDTMEISPPCLRYAQNKLTVYGPNKLKGEKLSYEKQQQGLLKATVHNGSHLRVLSGALCLSWTGWSASKVLVVATKHGIQSVRMPESQKAVIRSHQGAAWPIFNFCTSVWISWLTLPLSDLVVFLLFL